MYVLSSAHVYCSAIVVIVLFIAFNGTFSLTKFVGKSFFYTLWNSEIGLTIHLSSLINMYV